MTDIILVEAARLRRPLAALQIVVEPMGFFFFAKTKTVIVAIGARTARIVPSGNSGVMTDEMIVMLPVLPRESTTFPMVPQVGEQ